MHFMDIYTKRWWIRFSAIAVLIVLILSLFVYGFFIYMKNAYFPPLVQSEADYRNTSQTNGSYIRVRTDEIIDLYIQYEVEYSVRYGIVSMGSSKEVLEHYIAVWVGDHLLIVAVPSDQYEKLLQQAEGPYTFSGTYSEYDKKNYDDISKLIREDNDITAEELNKLLLPTYLTIKAPATFSWAYWEPCIWLTIALVPTYFLLMRKIRSTLKSLEIYVGVPEIACPIIDAELADVTVLQCKPMIVTKNYIISESNRAFFVMPINELVWAFKRIGRRKLLGFIPVGTNCQAVFFFSDLRLYVVDMQEADIDPLLSHVAEHSSVPVVGYDHEYAKLYQYHRYTFIELWKKGKFKRDCGTSLNAQQY